MSGRVTYPADDGLLLVNESSPTLGGGASVDRASVDATALIMACQGGHLPVVQALLGQDASVNQAALNDGTTALIVACAK